LTGKRRKWRRVLTTTTEEGGRYNKYHGDHAPLDDYTSCFGKRKKKQGKKKKGTIGKKKAGGKKFS